MGGRIAPNGAPDPPNRASRSSLEPMESDAFWREFLTRGHSAELRVRRLARTGEVLVTGAAAEPAGLDPRLERINIELKGKSAPTPVVRLVVAPPNKEALAR